MPNNFCPICQKEFVDILKHFSLYHDIEDIEHLQKKIDLAEAKEKRTEDFSKFIKEINEKLRNKEIAIDEWKRLRDEWNQMHILEDV